MGWRKWAAMGAVLGLALGWMCFPQYSVTKVETGLDLLAEAQAADPAPAGPPDQEPGKYLDLARSALGLGNKRQAYGLIEQAAQAVWQRLPLSLERTILLTEPARAYGVYQERPDNTYLVSGPDRPVFPGKGMPVYAYLEPIGYRVKRLENGRFAYNLAMDVSLFDGRGNHLFSKKDFMKNQIVSHHFQREMFLNVTVSLKGAPPGKYKLLLTLKDVYGGQKVSVGLPIRLALPPQEKK